METMSAAEKVARFKSFYDGTLNDGPLVGFYHGTYYPLRRFAAGSRLNAGPIAPNDVVVDSFRRDYERLFEIYTSGEGDGLWSAEAFYGIPWIEAACGAQVIADPEAGSIQARPQEDVPPQTTSIPNRSHTGWRVKLLEFVTMLVDLSASRFPVATTLQRGIGDTLAATLGSPDFLFRMMDDPGHVHSLADQIADNWIGLADDQLQLIPAFHGGVGTHFYDHWLPERGVVIQDDAFALLSPDLFHEFILPRIQRIASHFDSSIIHLHPAGFLPIDDILGLPVTAVELHRDLGGTPVEKLLPTYRRIQSRKPLIIWGDLTIEEARLLRDELNVNRLSVKPVVQGVEQAEAIWRVLKSEG
jgi:hypothetical protein